MGTTLKVRLPRPHALQRAVMESDAKRKVLVEGRRAGKTTLAAMECVSSGFGRKRALYAAPTHDQTSQFWDKCVDWLAEPIKAGVIYKNESLRLLRFPNGGRVKVKTAWNADTLRGDYADLLILDEFADMDIDAWDKVGAPMLLDNDGTAWFVGTPKRRNHFYQFYVRAKADTTGRWAAWHCTSHDNPHLSKEALAEITEDLTEDAYKQEILAEFLPNEGSVFRNLDKCMNAPANVTPEQHRGHRVIVGCDWGQKHDYTVFSVMCAQCRQEIAQARFRMLDYHIQRARLIEVAERWGVKEVWPEANSMGQPVIDELSYDPDFRRLGLTIHPFNMTASSKPPLIQSLALAFEKVEAQWLDDPIWTDELGAYEVKVSGSASRLTYNAPKGMHDDTVIARAIAWHGALTPQEVRYAPSLYS